MAIPDQTYFKMYGAQQGISFNFQAIDRDQLEQAQDEVRMLLRVVPALAPATGR